jgi:hypothetical protein
MANAAKGEQVRYVGSPHRLSFTGVDRGGGLAILSFRERGPGKDPLNFGIREESLEELAHAVQEAIRLRDARGA